MPGCSLHCARSWRGVLYCLAYLILPNLPVWIFQPQLKVMPHGYWNVEALLLGVFALFLPSSVTFLLLLLEMSAALIYLVCYTYQFSLESFFQAAHSFTVLPDHLQLRAWAALAVIVLLAWIVAYEIPRPKGKARAWTAAGVFVLCLLPVGIDTLNGYNPSIPIDHLNAASRLTLSPLAILADREAYFFHQASLERRMRDVELDSASMQVVNLLKPTSQAEAPNVVLVLVESWGLLRDPRLASALTSGYDDAGFRSKYTVSYGAAPFIGPTIAGEARELCHSQMEFKLLDISPARSETCLPDYFHGRNYRDIAVHGYVGGMFNRSTWYKTIGFDQMWFLHDLRQEGLPVCNGAFPGICDGSIAQWIGSTLLPASASRPEFVYWVTLNSHLPVPVLAEDGSCPAEAAPGRRKSFCSWFQLIERVHHSVQKLAEGIQGRPTIFVLVGDHMPPFSDPSLRAMFSQTEVPYVVLSPKAAAAPSSGKPGSGELRASGGTTKLPKAVHKDSVSD